MIEFRKLNKSIMFWVLSLGVFVLTKGSSATCTVQPFENGTVVLTNDYQQILDDAFFGCSELLHVIIPNSVTSIGNYAFAYSGLTSVNIPDSVTSIGKEAFFGCSDLLHVIIPDSFTSIGDHAFSSTGMTSVNIPDSVTSIGIQAFYQNYNLINISWGQNIQTIGNSAFSRCYALTEIILPNVDFIDSYAFANCSSLRSASINEAAVIKFNAFDNIGCQIVDTETKSFCNCTTCSATTTSPPTASPPTSPPTPPPTAQTVDLINPKTFGVVNSQLNDYIVSKGQQITWETIDTVNHNIVLTSDNSVSISNDDFISGSQAISNITLEPGVYNIKCLYHSTMTGTITVVSIPNIMVNGPPNCFLPPINGIVHIPEALTSLTERAFYNCTTITEVSLPPSVTFISNTAFQSSSVISVNLQNTNVEFVGDNAFSFSNIQQVEFPQTLTTLGQFVFYFCANLTSVDLSKTQITTIPIGSFELTSSLTTLLVPTSLTMINGFVASGLQTLDLAHTNLTYVDIFAFTGSKITTVTFPTTVEYISKYSFSGCTNLTRIEIPPLVQTIGMNTFLNCKSLEAVAILSSLAAINQSAFANCSALDTINIPSTVTSIHPTAFEGTPCDQSSYVAGANLCDCEECAVQSPSSDKSTNNVLWIGIGVAAAVVVAVVAYFVYTRKVSYTSINMNDYV